MTLEAEVNMAKKAKSIDDAAGNEPNLEDIAKRLANVEKDFFLNEIEPRIADAYNSITKYTDDKGRTRYKHDFSDEPGKVKELADSIFDALLDHIHLLEFDMAPKTYESLKGMKNAAGVGYVDTHVHAAFGLSREDLRKILHRNAENIRLKDILGIIQKQTNELYVPTKLSQIDESLDDSHIDQMKKYIMDKAKKHELPDYKKSIRDAYTMKDLKPVFRELALQIYGKKEIKEK